MKFTRRLFTAGIISAPAMACAKDTGLAKTCLSAIQNALLLLPPGPALLNSYFVQTGAGTTDFDLTQANAAYVYDNALAGLALLAGGDHENAKRIGDALAWAQVNDRFWEDGRLRNAYQAGSMAGTAKLPGWWDKAANQWREDAYQAGSQTGPLAWAMLLWSALGQAQPANAAASWLDDKLRATTGYYGGFYGFEPSPMKLLWQSTEQNTDLYAAFDKLQRHEDAAHAGGFVRAMFNPATGVFNAGLTPAGEVNSLLAADAGIWPYLAGLSTPTPAMTAIKSLRQGTGIGFSASSSSLWPEGTAFACLALLRQNSGLMADFTAALEAQVSPSGYLYASLAPVLATGFAVGPELKPGTPEKPFNYYRRPALAPTAWAVLSALAVNPLSA